MSRILLTGANGQVGWELQRTCPAGIELIALTREQLDLTDADAIRRTVRRHCPDIILNPAAYTAVDRAESEPELAQAVNAQAPAVLAEEAGQRGALLVHYSTDYVFDGRQDRPYREDDPPHPQSVYGRSKLAGEEAVRGSGCRHLILRTSWVYGVHGGNFVKTVLRLAHEREQLRIVADQFGAPTWARLLARTTWQLLPRFRDELAGVYHLTASGRTSWYEYAQTIVAEARRYDARLRDKSLLIQPIATHEYPLPATRPANSCLATDKLRTSFGVTLPDWQEDLHLCLAELLQR
ncbi:MAG: dTDP-4-dehydrorhamnose reductase [Sideroxydans sp.]